MAPDRQGITVPWVSALVAAGTPVVPGPTTLADPANDWSGSESELWRRRRRAGLPSMIASAAARILFTLWGVGAAFLVLADIALGWSTLFAHDSFLEGLWLASLALTVSVAVLAFRIADDLGEEIEDRPRDGPS